MDFSKAVKLKDSKENIPIDKHFKLYAGPGAGKTTFLTHHIHWILNQSKKLSKGKKVACITYTNIGVETLKSRLKDTGEDVEVSTIHSFLYKHILKPYLWMLDDCPFPIEHLDGHEEVKLGRSLLQEYKTRSKQYFDESLNKDLANSLGNLIWMLNGTTIELNFLKVYQSKVGRYNIKKNSYIVYKELCWENGLLSHDDVLYFSYLLLLQKNEIREIIRAKFPYILLDEFQDTSPLQAEIIKLIAEKETVIGVIGDPCQAIFSFQGTDENLFDQFKLDGMSLHYLENNHRSTEQIINILNHIRTQKDFDQCSPDKKVGEMPVLLIGSSFTAHKYVSKTLGINSFYTLAYRNNETNAIKYNFKDNYTEGIDLIFGDSSRGWMVYYIIHAIEYGKQLKLQDAIKFMKKAYRKIDGFSDKKAFSNLKRLLEAYNNFCEGNIKDFYNNYIFGHYGIKGKISSGKVKDYYEQLLYKRAATEVKISDDISEFKTIHKSKGDEFDNVLVVIPETNSVKSLEFLLTPDMSKEDHRVYYVALSRAKKKLYINVPNVSSKVLQELTHLNIEHIYL